MLIRYFSFKSKVSLDLFFFIKKKESGNIIKKFKIEEEFFGYLVEWYREGILIGIRRIWVLVLNSYIISFGIFFIDEDNKI